MGKRYSLEIWESMRRVLIRHIGFEDLAEDIYLETIRIFGEGSRLKMPKYEEGPGGEIYFWNPHRCLHSMRACNQLLAYLRKKLGEQTGDRIFNAIVVELGQGRRITVPTIRSILIQRRNEYIRKQFRGFNHKELAILYGLSERQVRRIVNN
ncbi:MAG: hypothetical protein GXP46_01805 [Deferribacteres bacterium]|nr:hypothetical protein [Deferribacteres bacterium]